MTLFLLINRYCARCEMKLNDDEIVTCADCTPIVGPRPEESTTICYFCGDAWANERTKVCTPCLKDIETVNHHAI